MENTIDRVYLSPARQDDTLSPLWSEIYAEIILNFNLLLSNGTYEKVPLGKFYVNEPNTCPGSLSFYLWKEAGLSYSELLDEMISIAIKEYKNKQKKIMSFDSNILDGFNGSKGCKGLKGLKN